MEELLEEVLKYVFFYILYVLVFLGASFLVVMVFATPIIWTYALFRAAPFFDTLSTGYSQAYRVWAAFVDGLN